MSIRARQITLTAVLLALLITLQALTKPYGQLVTGSSVNGVLAAAALLGGLGSAVTVALISPVMAFTLGIAPQLLTVPAIMAGNTVYVVLLHVLSGRFGKKRLWQIGALLAAAVAKFVVLYALVAGVICGLLRQPLLQAGALKAPMLRVLPATFSWPQLFTAVVGGTLALLICPILRKALHK